MTDVLAAFPATIELGRAQPPRRYVLRPELIAVHGNLPSGVAAAEAESLAPGITLLPATLAGRVGTGAQVTAVYSLGSAGRPLVPTGRILVRFGESGRAEAHRDAIERAGYRLVEPLVHAPHAAWVDSPDGPASALRGLGRLEALPGVVHVEPEMAGRRTTRN